MSRQKLSQVLTQVLDNLDSYTKNNDILRRAFSGTQTHTLDFHPNKILEGTKESLERDGYSPTPSEYSQIQAAALEFANTLRSKWKTSDYTYTVPQNDGKNIYRNITESAVYSKAKKEYNNKVSQIVNSDEPLKLVDAGHSLGYGVAETALLFALGKDLHTTIDIVSSVKERTKLHALIEKIPYGMLKSGGTTFNFTVQMEMESKAANRSTSAKLNSFGVPEDKFIGLLRKQVKDILESQDWGVLEGSPSMLQEAEILFADALKGKRTQTKKPSSKSKKTKTYTRTRKVVVDRTPVNLGLKKNQNWLSIINIINSRLPDVVKSNMGAPGLINRTGQFAESARVSRVDITPQGLPSFVYTYNKTPYGVFDPRFGALPWATPQRDPNKLIDASIRQIASSLAIGRFYLRRE